MNHMDIADKIVQQAIDYGFVGTYAQIVNALDDAVKEERERCAKIAEDERVDAEDTQHAADIAYNDACKDIAKRIREGT